MNFRLGLVVGRRDVAEKAADEVVGERMIWRFFFFLEMFREIFRDSPGSFDGDFAGNVLSGLVWRFG